MPRNDGNEIMERATVAGGTHLFFWMFKWQWRFYRFTAFWLIILALLLDTGLTTSGVPGEIATIPVILDVIFCVFWTTRNTVRFVQKHHLQPSPESPRAQEQTDGVFFGTMHREV